MYDWVKFTFFAAFLNAKIWVGLTTLNGEEKGDGVKPIITILATAIFLKVPFALPWKLTLAGSTKRYNFFSGPQYRFTLFVTEQKFLVTLNLQVLQKTMAFLSVLVFILVQGCAVRKSFIIK